MAISPDLSESLPAPLENDEPGAQSRLLGRLLLLLVFLEFAAPRRVIPFHRQLAQGPADAEAEGIPIVRRWGAMDRLEICGRLRRLFQKKLLVFDT